MFEARGFSGHLHALNGTYNQVGDNHGKPTYNKPAMIEGANQCHLYFWDERDGDSLAGWWMAPTVGGEQVWAHCPSRSSQPPPSGWKVPWHASEADPNIRIESKGSGGGGGGAGAKRGTDGKGNPAQGQKSWGNTSQSGGNSWGGNQGKGGGGGGWNSGGKGGGGGGNKGNANQGKGAANAAHLAQLENHKKQKRDNILKQISQAVEAVEKAMRTLAEEKNDAKADRSRTMGTARTAIASARRIIDVNVKGGMIDESLIDEQKSRIVGHEKALEQMQEDIKKEQMLKLKEIEDSITGAETQKRLGELEAAVEKTKDAAVLFTCEMAEHIKAEDALESHEKTEKEAKIAGDLIKDLKDTFFTKERELRDYLATDTDKIRKSISEMQGKVTAFEREVRNVQGQSAQAVKKAKMEVERKKQVEQREQKRKEQELVAQWNRDILGFIYQVNLISEDSMKSNHGSRNVEQLAQAESRLMGLKNELEKRSELKECNGNSKKELSNQGRKIESGILKITKLRKEVSNRDHDKLDMLGIQVAVAARALKGDKTDEAFFQEFTNKAPKMNSFHFEKFVKKTNVKCDLIKELFNEICHVAAAGSDSLTYEEFTLHALHNYFEVFKSTHLTIDKEEESAKVEGGNVEKGALVDLIDGPIEVEESIIRAKCILIQAGEQKEGWVTLRANANESLKRFSPLYTVLTETVLTDTFSLKGFKVVRRIKKDEKFRALTIPSFNEEAEMLRVRGITSENESAWITVKGNRGTPLLKNEEVTKDDEKEIEAEEFSEDLLHTLLKNMADKEQEKADAQKKELCDHMEKVTALVNELATMDAEGQAPTKEEVDALVVKVDETFRGALKMGSEAKQAIQSISRQISNVDAGPYKDLREHLNEVLEEVAETVGKITGMREQQRKHTISIKKKEKEAREAKEMAEAEALAETILKSVEGKQEAIQAQYDKMSEIDIMEISNKAPLEIADEIKRIQGIVKGSEALGETTKVWCTENQPKQQHGCLQKASHALANCKSKTTKVLQLVDFLKKAVIDLQKTMKEKSQVEIGVGLTKYLQKKDQAIDALFAEITDKETMDITDLDKFLRKIKCASPCLELICKGLGTELTKETFANLAKVNYRCLKRCLLTDAMEVTTCKRIRWIEPEEIVTILEQQIKDDETGIVRIRARAENDNLEGWMPYLGNTGVEYLKLRGPWYKVVRDTVFTGDFSMENVKVIRRLKVGDTLRCLQYPRLEEKSGLLRMQAASCDDNKTVGWVTIRGNQGSVYVADCDMLDEAADVEMKDAKEC